MGFFIELDNFYEIRAENQPSQPNISSIETCKYYTQIEMQQTTKSVSEHEMNKCGMFWTKKELLHYMKVHLFLKQVRIVKKILK